MVKLTPNVIAPRYSNPEGACADITVDGLMAAMMSDDGAADGVDLSKLELVGGIGWLSPGATAWTELTQEPGTYVAMCFVFDPSAMTIHAAEGMIQILTVS